jgi:hypothetical protein
MEFIVGAIVIGVMFLVLWAFSDNGPENPA